MEEVAQFNFKNREDILKGIGNEERPAQSLVSSTDSTLPLPDIKEARQKKLMEEELARMEEEKEISKPKIKRSDRAAFMKVSSRTLYMCRALASILFGSGLIVLFAPVTGATAILRCR